MNSQPPSSVCSAGNTREHGRTWRGALHHRLTPVFTARLAASLLCILLLSPTTTSADADAPDADAAEATAADDDVPQVISTRHQVGDDPHQTYFYMTRRGEETQKKQGLLVVLPGGSGNAEFETFVKRILDNAAPRDFAVMQIVAPKWNEQQKTVWPTKMSRVPGQKFDTEQLIFSCLEHAHRIYHFDSKQMIIMGWSSSGPPLYDLSLAKKSPFRGYFISQSVFKPKFLPPLKGARGKRYYIEHSPEDEVCPYRMAEQARDNLTEAGGRVEFTTYTGGHGWRGDVYGRMRTGFSWLLKSP